MIIVHVEALLVAFQLQPVGAVMVTVPEPPLWSNASLVGDTAKLQGTPGCVTVKVWPVMVSVPVRDNAVRFGATVNATFDDPAPLRLPASTAIHEALLDAIQGQLGSVFNATLPAPPLDRNDCDVVPSEYVHGTVDCNTDTTAPELPDESVVIVTTGTASSSVMLCPGSRM